MAHDASTRWCDLLQDRLQVTQAIPVGRAALGLLAVLIDWVDRGGAPKVALSANVCHDVLAALLAAGCEPVFCDIDPADACVPLHEWRRARQEGASVACAVHLYGNPVDLAPIRTIFPAPDCLLIDDAAQALGALTPDGAWVGAAGDVGLLSFGATKHITCGGAALVLNDLQRADRLRRVLDSLPQEPAGRREALEASFRARFQLARKELYLRGGAAAAAFAGLLDGYAPCLHIGAAPDDAQALIAAFQAYPAAAALRRQKAARWREGLASTGLVPVGMGEHAVPWRYVCRLPGIGWGVQNDLGNALRAAGLNVSHWYLPAHWLCGYPAGSLPGVEELSREVFQFWVDAATPFTAIEDGAQAVTRIVMAFQNAATKGAN